ncbi:helix-turn-helix transcriptional regulator [Streptomyces carminius]|uniref:Helix-turn-helix transcriptional regulator n=1 Tax=Streptomyces carminius TaxID=2665496 RepID=A0A2M8LTV1_9ACTN|nr:response regulator transcription factor [Streptomyces carminius]PJE95366.1 helix-turn-helix transcriptional regulator [Streptomyces carminius]
MTATGHIGAVPQTAGRLHGRGPGGNRVALVRAQTEGWRAGERIPVTVHAPDPISLAGVSSHLRQHPEIEIVPEGKDHPGTVAVLLTETLDEATTLRLRRLVRSEGTRVVLVAGLIREAELLEIIECGVGAILWRREATPQRLHQAVLAASRNEGNLPPDLLTRLITQVGRMQRGAPDRPGPLAGLAPREVDVIRLVAEGLDTREIAGKLSYSERTVKNVLHGMTTRLQLRNRAHAVAYALREGYI